MKFKNIFTNPIEVQDIIKATDISSVILKKLKESVNIGVSALDINQIAEEQCAIYQVKPAFLGVEGKYFPFPKSLCVSVNDEVLHGLPSSNRIFKTGDIIKLDFGIIYKGFFTDHCITIGLGDLSKEEIRLISTAKLCVEEAVKEAIVGNFVGDISYKLEQIALLGGFNFVKTYCGHGIGRSLHESPEVLSWGSKKTGVKLEEGMLLCIENQLTMGKGALKLDKDGWTLKTVDGLKGAMFEHMVLVGKKQPKILTSFFDL